MQFPYFSKATNTMMTVADVALCIGKPNLFGIDDAVLAAQGFVRIRNHPNPPVAGPYQQVNEVMPELINPVGGGEPYFQQRLILQELYSDYSYPDPADPAQTISVTKLEQEYAHMNGIKIRKVAQVQEDLKKFTDAVIVWPGVGAIPASPVTKTTLTQLSLAKMAFDAGATGTRAIVFANGTVQQLNASQLNDCIVSVADQAGAMVAKAALAVTNLLNNDDIQAVLAFSSTVDVFNVEAQAAAVAALSSTAAVQAALQAKLDAKKANGDFNPPTTNVRTSGNKD